MQHQRWIIYNKYYGALNENYYTYCRWQYLSNKLLDLSLTRWFKCRAPCEIIQFIYFISQQPPPLLSLKKKNFSLYKKKQPPSLPPFPPTPPPPKKKRKKKNLNNHNQKPINWKKNFKKKNMFFLKKFNARKNRCFF